MREWTTWRRALTSAEQDNTRRAIRCLCKKHGSAEQLRKAIGVAGVTLASMLGKRPVSAGMAIRIARAADAPLAEILSGAWPAVMVRPT